MPPDQGLPSQGLRPSFLAPLAFAGGLALMGCQTHDCVSTCERLFTDGVVDGESSCNIEHAGLSQQDLLSDCQYECEAALDNPGTMGNYDPNERNTGSTSVELKTDLQAAAWMDCVWANSCEFLDEGYCAPTSFSR